MGRQRTKITLEDHVALYCSLWPGVQVGSDVRVQTSQEIEEFIWTCLDGDSRRPTNMSFRARAGLVARGRSAYQFVASTLQAQISQDTKRRNKYD
jgi:hypothetical protein